jgi:hypothetical protein
VEVGVAVADAGGVAHVGVAFVAAVLVPVEVIDECDETAEVCQFRGLLLGYLLPGEGRGVAFPVGAGLP